MYSCTKGTQSEPSLEFLTLGIKKANLIPDSGVRSTAAALCNESSCVEEARLRRLDTLYDSNYLTF